MAVETPLFIKTEGEDSDFAGGVADCEALEMAGFDPEEALGVEAEVLEVRGNEEGKYQI